MYIESCLAVNFIADLALFCAVSRSLGLFSLRRCALCAAVGALYAALAAARPVPWASLPALFAAPAIAALLLARRGGTAVIRLTALSLAAGTALCGGLGRLVPGGGPLAGLTGILLGWGMLGALYSKHPPHSSRWRVRLGLARGGSTVRLNALIDTGNRLREPLSALPVLIAEEDLVRDVLPGEGWREVGFGAVGGGGRMRCFRPEALWIEQDGKRLPAPEVWVAVSPGPLPGPWRALAPCEFAAYIHG